ncbi:MAG: NAD-dependent epimerase/dehydratase family protein [Planctomycetota bacterium]|nr:NAD-dependent epimerase/dehydratase family protein [Planctomycetota bacterium]
MNDSSTRRALLGASALLAAGALARRVRADDKPAGGGRASKPLKLLVLGGTRFLGPAIVDYALARGHKVTLFNRGRSNPELYPDVEKLEGNRGSHGDPGRGRAAEPVDLKSLEGRTWDAAIDTSGYWPEFVEASSKQLAEQVGHYTFISSISVYPGFGKSADDLDEDSSLGDLKPREEYKGFDYGAFKALCEQACEKHMPGRVANVRPGLIVGDRDETRRFGEWPLRVHAGGEVLAPGRPEGHCQFIDVKDLGRWCVHLAENNTAGVFNANGFPAHLSFAEFLHGCKAAIRPDCSFTWVDEAFLATQKLNPWQELPNWMPSDVLPWVKVERAIAAGLTFRPICDTIRDALAWDLAKRAEVQAAHAADPKSPAWKARLAPEREREVLAAWHASRKAPAPEPK